VGGGAHLLNVGTEGGVGKKSQKNDGRKVSVHPEAVQERGSMSFAEVNEKRLSS